MMQLSNDYPIELTTETIAIGAFHAMERGILTVNSAGNDGPRLYSITSFAPWIFTVAASDTDRRIVSKVLLGDGTTLVANSINAFPSSDGESPLLYGKEVTSRCSETDARNCEIRCLDSSLVEHKVVLCDQDTILPSVKVAGGLGYIIPNMGKNISSVMPSPVAALNTKDVNLLKIYKNSTKKPQVQILKSEAIVNPTAPLVASYSSRGPSNFIPDILKPDVTAPGVEILAAFSPMASPSGDPLDKRSVKYNILSGTSMACPHVTAAAAFVKSFHPSWSPSAIKSKLMTTALEMNPTQNTDAEFAYGSGHIDPQKAKDPGLVYETSREDYLKIWCNISRSSGSLKAVNATCPVNMTTRELNYPSMAAQVNMKSAFVVSFSRMVTNVGLANSRYVASIHGDSNLHISIDPDSLQFTELKQKKSFVVTVKGKGINSSPTMESVSLLWTDGIHKVRSPIVVYTAGPASSGGASKPPWFCKTFVILLIVVFLSLKN